MKRGVAIRKPFRVLTRWGLMRVQPFKIKTGWPKQNLLFLRYPAQNVAAIIAFKKGNLDKEKVV